MTDRELDAWIDSGTVVLGIAVHPEWRAAVRLHLKITADHAQAVLSFPMSDEMDPAPVFRA